MKKYVLAGDAIHGLLWSQDHSLVMPVPPQRLRLRLGPDRDFAFFHAVVTAEDILELGDPLRPDEKGSWPLVRTGSLPGKPATPKATTRPMYFSVLPTEIKFCPCGARQHKGDCVRALEAERHAAQKALEALGR